MPGPAPKDRSARRRRNEPAAGEWVDLRPLDKPVLPALPKRSRGEGEWSSRTRAMWEAWRADPATAQFSPADVSYAVMTAFIAEDYHRGGKVTLAGELRLRMDGLGLTAKGRRSLRWRIAPPGEVVELASRAASSQSARRDRLSTVRAFDPALVEGDG